MTIKGAAVPKRGRRVAAVKIPRSCQRCGRRLSSAQLRDGMAVLEDGYVRFSVCNSCISVDEMAMMVIKEATLEYALNAHDNRVVVRTKKFATE
jgi:hypothetical protein